MKACTPSDQRLAACPCGRLGTRGRALTLRDCCGPYLLEGQAAPDAHSLMRSRYSAYVRQRLDYLVATWHPSTVPANLTLEPGLLWLGLQVRAHRCVDAEHAEVEFVARSRLGGRGQRLHEISRFVLEGSRWWYLDGDLK